MRSSKIIAVLLSATCLVSPALAKPVAKAATVERSNMIVAVSWRGLTANGVTTTNDGRIFANFPRLDGQPGMSIGEWDGGQWQAFPNAEKNDNDAARNDPANHFVRTNALRIGSDGALWVVDTGTEKDGAAPLEGGAKIVRIDVKNNDSRIYLLDAAVTDKSFIDDIRFNGDYAYITDAGENSALIVLNLKTGAARRVLENHPSLLADHQMTGEGKPVFNNKGAPLFINADQLEVSPDGKYFYYQPCNGPMSRIETRYLIDASLSDEELASHIELWFDTPSTGGTAMDRDGNLYVTDVDNNSVLRITPDKEVTTIMQDKNLVWPDALWIDNENYLWIPAAQMNRDAAYNNGKSRQTQPFHIYKMKIDAEPLRR